MARPLKIALPALVVAAGFAVAGILAATRKPAKTVPLEEPIIPVETTPVVFEDARPMLRFFGEIAAGRDVELRAAVAGPVVSVAPEFADGAAASAGARLLAIDPFDYEQAVAESAAARDEARARLGEMRARLESERRLLEEEAEQTAIRERELARRESLIGDAVSERALDDARLALSQARAQAERRRQDVSARAAQVAQQEAILARFEAALARARRALDDTVIAAPFDGWLADADARPGTYLRVGDRVARLIASDGLEARFHLPDAAFGRLAPGAVGAPAAVAWTLGSRTVRRSARVTRVAGEIDPATGGVAAWAALEAPAPEEAGGPALPEPRPGAFVEVFLADRVYPRVARLPETALYAGAGADAGRVVYVVTDGRLEARAAEVAGRDGADALVRGDLAEGDAVVVTRLTEIGPGLKVSVP